jgi:sporulation protein YlmC with PRC-barrel domain
MKREHDKEVPMLELKEGMSVLTPSGEEVGRINRFVVDPTTNEVTHVVVQKGWLLPEDKVIPFERVSRTDDEKLVLNEEIGDFDELPSFEETYYVRATDERPGDLTPAGDPAYHYAPAYYWYPSQVNMVYPSMGLPSQPWTTGQTKRNIPEDTVPIQEGTDVHSSDGKEIGDVERLFVDGESKQVTHFLISQGLFFKDRKLVPVHWVRRVEEDAVHLAVSSEVLNRLPAYED